MNIRELHVEGFGRWNALSLRGFTPGLNVIYGPNESGKTTLLELVRTVLYGFAPSGSATCLRKGLARRAAPSCSRETDACTR